MHIYMYIYIYTFYIYIYTLYIKFQTSCDLLCIKIKMKKVSYQLVECIKGLLLNRLCQKKIFAFIALESRLIKKKTKKQATTKQTKSQHAHKPEASAASSGHPSVCVYVHVCRWWFGGPRGPQVASQPSATQTWPAVPRLFLGLPSSMNRQSEETEIRSKHKSAIYQLQRDPTNASKV